MAQQVETIQLRREDGDVCHINANDPVALQAMNEAGYFTEEQWAAAEPKGD